MIDIIIPVLNEEEFLKKNADYYKELGSKAHIIFVDGGSIDSTIEVAKNFGDVIQSRKGRALQKNAGAQAANSDYLLFLHADSLVSPDSLGIIQETLSNGFCGGCFTLKVDDKAFIFRLFEYLVNFRARFFKVMDGDLGQFVRRELFFKLGGYDQVATMEDILFGKKLSKKGKIAVLPQIIKASSRKWREKGFSRLFGQYAIAYIRLWTGRLNLKEAVS